MKTLNFFKLLILLFFPLNVFTQSVLSPLENAPNDGVFISEHIPNRRPIPYVHVREADVMWQKRVWRIIDLREKINQSLYFPLTVLRNGQRISFFEVIKRGIVNNRFPAYSTDIDLDKEFEVELPLPQAMKALTQMNIMKDSIGQPLYDSTGAPVMRPDTLTPQDIAQYWLKEDWFFDKQRSIMDVRILGLCPVMETTDDQSGQFRSYRQLFWLYYPSCRSWCSIHQAYNPYNDAEWRSFDEIFHKRMFSSYITQESTVYNRPIGAYATGIESLLESERIKDDIFNIEHDMWNY